MYYFKINELIAELISQVPNVKEKKNFIGCKPYCKSQIIALDELELIKKLLKEHNIRDISSEEFKEIKASTKSAYYINLHCCVVPEEKKAEIEEEERKKQEEYYGQELLKDRKRIEEKFLFDPKIDHDYIFKKQQEANKVSGPTYSLRESTMSYGVSILVSFFLIFMGTYFFCDWVLEMKKSNTYKITIVVSVIVLITEAILLIIKLDKDNAKYIQTKGLNKNSIAYKFNSDYRNKIENEVNKKKKVHQKEKNE